MKHCRMVRALTVALAAFILAVGLAVPVSAGPYEDGYAALSRGDYARALRLFRPLADQGNALAQYSLGVMYTNGHGVPQDYAQAVAWYRKAADQSLAAGQNNLGFMYTYGYGVPQDYTEAAKWYWKAADQGDTTAQRNLETLYTNGHAVRGRG